MASGNRREFYIETEIFPTETTKQNVRTVRGARMDDVYVLVKTNSSLIAKRETERQRDDMYIKWAKPLKCESGEWGAYKQVSLSYAENRKRKI